MSLFSRPSGVRQRMPTTASGSFSREVRTDTEFRAALSEVVARYSSTPTATGIVGAQGGEIVIAGSWTTSGYVIPPQAASLTIRALPGCKLVPSAAGVTLFKVSAPDVTIRNVFADKGANYFDKLVTAEVGTLAGASVSAQRLNVDQCVAAQCLIYVDNSAGLATDVVISKNRQILGQRSAPVRIFSRYCIVERNYLLPVAEGDVIWVFGANAGWCRILHNRCGEIGQTGYINTATSLGFNVIEGNVLVNSIHSYLTTTDAVGLNQ